MRVIPFVKMSGTGNDFLMVDNRWGLLAESEKSALAASACTPHVSIGADGLILVEAPLNTGHDYRMRIFNADGSEAEMCGNGSRCIAVFAKAIGAAGANQKIDTLAGTVEARVADDGKSARVQLSRPTKLEIKKGVDVLGEPTDIHFINTGVPHAVIFVKDASKVDVRKTGACVRYHEVFKPKGTNANFVQILGDNAIKVRTYERGVEDETQACGTGATASAIAAGLAFGMKSPVKVTTSGGSELGIHFTLINGSAERPYLEGAVNTICKGEYFWH